MAGEVAAKRHARAVFEIALEENGLDKWHADLDLMADVFSDPGLLMVLEAPGIRFEDKADAVDRNLSGVSPKALNLARLLILKRRSRMLAQIAREYNLLMDRQEGIEHAEVTTAVEMSLSTELKIKDQLARLTGSKIEISRKIDPGIMGGFVVRVGDRVIDASLLNRLQKLKKSIVQRAA